MQLLSFQPPRTGGKHTRGFRAPPLASCQVLVYSVLGSPEPLSTPGQHRAGSLEPSSPPGPGSFRLTRAITPARAAECRLIRTISWLRLSISRPAGAIMPTGTTQCRQHSQALQSSSSPLGLNYKLSLTIGAVLARLIRAIQPVWAKFMPTEAALFKLARAIIAHLGPRLYSTHCPAHWGSIL